MAPAALDIFIFVLLVGLVYNVDGRRTCSLEEVHFCLSAMEPHHNEMNPELFPTFSDEQLESICR